MLGPRASSLLQHAVQAIGATEPVDTIKEGTVTAQALNAETHETALRMLAEPERAMYSQRGRQLTFLPDRRGAEA
jgi:hypothetical protein